MVEKRAEENISANTTPKDKKRNLDPKDRNNFGLTFPSSFHHQEIHNYYGLGVKR